MRMNLRAACITIVALAGLAGCGSYSAPNNSPTAPDSGGGTDSMPPPPGGYDRQ
jgi:hypothetical protein